MTTKTKTPSANVRLNNFLRELVQFTGPCAIVSARKNAPTRESERFFGTSGKLFSPRSVRDLYIAGFDLMTIAYAPKEIAGNDSAMGATIEVAVAFALESVE